MVDLCHLIYNSAATAPMSEQALVELLEGARNYNAAVGVTGMLLYTDECFFQVLEGPHAAVHELAAKIERDARHSQMTVIIDEPIHRRSFAEWTMGFANVAPAELSRIQGLNDFFDGQRVLAEVDAGRAKKLLAAFGQGRWRVRVTNRRPAFAPAPTAQLLPERPGFSIAYAPIVDADQRSIHAYRADLRGSGGEPAAEIMQRVAIDEIDEFDADARRHALGLASRLGLQYSLHLHFVPRSPGAAANYLASTVGTAEQCGIDPSRLSLEITHEASIINPVEAASSLDDVRSLGVRICIAEFGSSYAGLSLLEHYRPDSISLNRDLIRNVDDHGPRQAIVRGVAQTCQDLGIDVIATGVETTAEFAWLAEAGLHLFAGPLIGEAGFESLPTPSVPIT